MAARQNRENMETSEAEIWNAIAAFEKILEVMPDDRSSLETLYHAYEHIGDRAQALEYLLRLSKIVVDERDSEAAAFITDKFDEYGTSDERIAEQQALLRSVVQVAVSDAQIQRQDEETSESSADTPEAHPKTLVLSPDYGEPVRGEEQVRFRVADELSFAWRLFESGEITQDEYASVAHDLAELSVDGHLSTVSVLHALEGRAFSGMERVMGYVSRESKTPIISLQSFEPPPEACQLLSKTFVIRRGAFVFDFLQNDALVVVMNPFDRKLRTDIQSATGRNCHFFMALPRDFDAMVASLMDG